jgi:hypothetical protein
VFSPAQSGSSLRVMRTACSLRRGAMFSVCSIRAEGMTTVCIAHGQVTRINHDGGNNLQRSDLAAEQGSNRFD